MNVTTLSITRCLDKLSQQTKTRRKENLIYKGVNCYLFKIIFNQAFCKVSPKVLLLRTTKRGL